VLAAEQAQLNALLASRGIRPTQQRREIVEVLVREPNDATAQRLHELLRTRGSRVGLATVYRTLALLTEHGVVDQLDHSRGETCYRLCSGEHHHHLVCSDCHRVVELADCEVERWLEEASAVHGFVPTGHRLEATGICASCRS
jgi:Fur family ferric uptake transcriptional regulator